MLLLFLGGGLQAQSVDLIEAAGWTLSDLNASQLQRYQKFVNNYGANSIQKVKLNTLTAALDTNELVIPDPYFANPLTFRSQRVEFESAQEFYWYGKLTVRLWRKNHFL